MMMGKPIRKAMRIGVLQANWGGEAVGLAQGIDE